jgi:hypothetical protein
MPVEPHQARPERAETLLRAMIGDTVLGGSPGRAELAELLHVLRGDDRCRPGE